MGAATGAWKSVPDSATYPQRLPKKAMVKNPLGVSNRKRPALRFAVVAAFGLALSGANGCSEPSKDPGVAGDVPGSVQVALQAAPGLVLDAAAYSLTGPGGFSRTAPVNIGSSATLSFIIGAIPAGTGYVLSVTASSTDGSTSCNGTSVAFAVIAGHVASVPLGLSCHQGSQTGSAVINGTINLCPVIDGISVSPAEVRVGGTIDLAATAHDSDEGPAPLTYLWTADSGVLSDTSAAHSSFACTVPGLVTLTLTVADGDPQPGCASTSTVMITCSPSDAAGGAGGSSGAGDAGGAIGTCPSDACAVGDKRCADGSAIQVCAVDPNGCTTWTTVACPTGEVCERHEPASCADPSWAAWPLPGDQDLNITDNMDGTFTDNTTGLMWQRRGESSLTHAEAVQYCQTLGDGGHHDWRLPTLMELISTTGILTDGEAVPFLLVYGAAMTSTPYLGYPDTYWCMDFLGGVPSGLYASVSDAHFWAHCVR